jgi:hypothetical protein
MERLVLVLPGGVPAQRETVLPLGDLVRRPARPPFWRRLACIVVGAALAVALHAGPLAAQQRLVVTGTVQWADSSRIQVMTDANVSVSVDVSRLPQGSYPSLRSGDRLSAVGTVAPDRSRLIAQSVTLADPGGGYWTVFPQAP